MRRFGGERVKGFMSWANLPEDEPIEHGMITRSIAQAQVRVEGYNFDIRKRVLEYDDVVNKQREVIYAQRREILDKDGLHEEYLKILDETIQNAIDEFTESEDPAEWDLDGLYHKLLTIFPVPIELTVQSLDGHDQESLEALLIEAGHKAYDRKTAEMSADMKQAERLIMLRAIDLLWQRHLTDLDILREGIGLVSVAQRDPLVEYKREAFKMWEDLQDTIRAETLRGIFSVQPAAKLQPVRRQMQMTRAAAASNGAGERQKAEPVRKSAKERLGRNDPCWCGSGKKYKHCHYQADRMAARE
jgi:preprotein translocase subunit SecA